MPCRSRKVVEPLLPLIFDLPSQEIVTYGNREAKPQGTRIPWECIAMRHFSKLSGHLLGSTAGCWDWDVPKIIKMHIFGRFCSPQKCIILKCLLEFYFFLSLFIFSDSSASEVKRTGTAPQWFVGPVSMRQAQAHTEHFCDAYKRRECTHNAQCITRLIFVS